jgi:ABC-type dipeptide/oligopeptide/nickel transport system ATPase subunit
MSKTVFALDRDSLSYSVQIDATKSDDPVENVTVSLIATCAVKGGSRPVSFSAIIFSQKVRCNIKAGTRGAANGTLQLPPAALQLLRRHARGEEEVSAPAFLKLVKAASAALKMDFDMLKRPLNVGFSGGEKKRMEILQMALLEPSLLILDETDSGLDIDALRIVSEGVNALRSPDRAMLVITHYQRLLDYIKPDRVHVLAAGRIVASGGPELALQLEAEGYDKYLPAAA